MSGIRRRYGMEFVIEKPAKFSAKPGVEKGFFFGFGQTTQFVVEYRHLHTLLSLSLSLKHTHTQSSIGDMAYFYHSSCKTPAIVGVCEVVSEAFPDPTQFVKSHTQYDPK